jgi:hypothetical protein
VVHLKTEADLIGEKLAKLERRFARAARAETMSTRITIPDLPIYDIAAEEKLRDKLLDSGVTWKTLCQGVPDYIVVITEASSRATDS